jgi:hypothetical protein
MNMIIAAHAGTGKSTLAKMYPHKFVDFVCMPYKYYLPDEFDENAGETCKADLSLEMRDDYPYNYFEAIKEAMRENEDKILLIPPDRYVLRLLREADIPYGICYPVREAKEAYRQRYIDRGNTDEFLSVFIDRWDIFMDTMENDASNRHIVMEPHQFLSDVITVLDVDV